MRTKLILSAVIAVLAGLLYLTGNYAKKQKQRAERQENNVYSLTEEVHRYRAFGDSIEVASVRTMEFKESEWRKVFAQQAAKITQLQNVKHPTQYIEIETVIRDTIYTEVIRNDSTISFEYNDKWLSLQGEIPVERQGEINNDVRIAYSVRDSINIVEHKRKKRLWYTLWIAKKTDHIRTEVWSSNPHSNISTVKSVKIE